MDSLSPNFTIQVSFVVQISLANMFDSQISSGEVRERCHYRQK